MQVRKFITLIGISLLLASSMTSFVVNRAIATVKTGKQLFHLENISSDYTKNDRYAPLSAFHALYPTRPVYFLANSYDPADVSTSWQMIQTFYLLYPEKVQSIKIGADEKLINTLANADTDAIVMTPFKQPFLAVKNIEKHPHSEYYLYIVTKK